MDRVRRAGTFALFLALVPSVLSVSPIPPASRVNAVAIAASVAWPTSTLLVSEVATGGASASDEFAELTNAGAVPVDLIGFELVYVTSSGGTVTRKAAWTAPTILEPGAHLLVANAAGIHAAVADATYTGGFAATGGSVALRPIGGVVVDAVGWGDASGSFVEGAAAPAPASGSSIERLPGGPLGNGVDSNDNAADFTVRDAPSPQNLAAAPTPTPAPGADPVATSVPTASSSQAPTQAPTAAPTPTPTPPPTPVPTSTPTSAPTSAPTPTSTLPPTPTPSPIPTPPPSSIPIANARIQPIGATVTVAGIVTAEAGLLGAPNLVAIQDGSGGIIVRIPNGVAAPGRGGQVEVRGPLADPYGQIEIRPSTAGVVIAGSGIIPEPVQADAASLGESLEGRLVTVHGTVEARPTKSTSGDVTFYIVTLAGKVRIAADASSGIKVDSVTVGATYDVIGVAGQRASRKGALDGYRVSPRGTSDLRRGSAPAATSSPTPVASGPATSTAGPDGGVVTIATAIRRAEGPVVVEGLVTTRADLLDATGRRFVIEDRTAGVEILGPTDAPPPAVGTKIRVEGTIARAYDAPRVKADRIVILAVGARPLALDLQRAPTAAQEWRLVRVGGTVTDVTKLGDRWRAELSVGRDRVVITGLAGAGIAATALVEGRTATIVGIVRRPYPGATDRRWSIAPRSAADIVMGGARSATPGRDEPDPPAGPGAAGTKVGAASSPPNTDLVDLASHIGQVVRVGGLVAEVTPEGFLLDDGTAVGQVALDGAAAEYLPLLEPGDALNATGRVEAHGSAQRIVVDDPSGLVRVGDPTLDATAAGPTAAPSVRESARPRAASRLAGGLFGPGSPGTAELLGIVLVSLVSVAVTVLRRRRGRRVAAARLAARLAAVTATQGPTR